MTKNNSTLEAVLEKLNALRARLHSLLETGKPMTDAEVLLISQEIDSLHVEFLTNNLGHEPNDDNDS